MTGFRTTGNYVYYVCGSQPYRRGKGCASAIYVPKEGIEEKVVCGVAELVEELKSLEFVRHFANKHIRTVVSAGASGHVQTSENLRKVDEKLANIRKAIENGLQDADWANDRLRALIAERATLLAASEPAATNAPAAPVVDPAAMQRLARDPKLTLSKGKMPDIKKLVGDCVRKIRMAPERRQVEITYRVPEPFVKALVAGARSEANHKRLENKDLGVFLWNLPTKGRRNDLGWAAAAAR